MKLTMLKNVGKSKSFPGFKKILPLLVVLFLRLASFYTFKIDFRYAAVIKSIWCLAAITRRSGANNAKK